MSKATTTTKMNSGTIKCIFFIEFHPMTGTKISYQFPEDYNISKEFFDAIHIYIITKPELQSRLITVNALNHKIVGCPVCIENEKYERNALMFNLCFLFDSATDTCQYEPSVKKIAAYLTQLELENNLISDETKKASIKAFLQDVMTKLNSTGSCRMFMGESCTVHLKLSPSIEDPKPVLDYDVPIFLEKARASSFNRTQWDLTTQQVLMYIDGFNHVAKIAVEGDVEINLVKACLQNLIHFNVITIISIFQYSNIYTCTEQIRRLADDSQLQDECLRFVAVKGRVQPHFRDVFMLYSSLTPGFTVKDLCVRFNPHALKIDEKLLIQFGLMKRLIRRLQGYPLKLPTDTESPHKVQAISKWLNGNHSFDEICCKLGLTYQDLDERVEGDPSIIVCWK